ncbi:MAG: hypothetical protein ACI8WB_004946 [Phenylobacterium sp.]|jgi:hypothetical protein
MNTTKRITTWLFLLLSLTGLIGTVTFSANAEQMKRLGNWNVHYIAFGSTFLTPKIAQAYDIKRSGYSGVVNISVLSSSKSHTAQKVEISGEAKNLLGQIQELSFKEIIEGDSVYYIAQIDYRNEETYRFDIKLKQGNQSQKLKFSQQFYVD